jgi:small conductance mechanosensitive channel
LVIRVVVKTAPLKQWEVGRELRRRIKIRFDKKGIRIPFPHRVLIWEDKEQSKPNFKCQNPNIK